MRRSTWLWLGGVGVLIVVALVLVAVRRPTTYPLDSPEGVVQRYLEDVFAGDPDAAAGWWAPEVAERCGRFLEDVAGGTWEDRAALVAVDVDDDRAVVKVTVSRAGGLFESGASRTVRFRLERTPAGWRIAEPPWPVEWCEGEPLPPPGEE